MPDASTTKENLEQTFARGHDVLDYFDARAKYIDFHSVIPARRMKTKIWLVATKGGAHGTPLGFVKWFPSWRGYAFFPNGETVYDKRCLRELADFCEQATAKHRASRKA